MPYSNDMEYFSGNYHLSTQEQQVNAKYIYYSLKYQKYSWTRNAIAAMLGNFDAESGINPGIWAGLNNTDPSNAYGLAQWKPSTKFTNWANLYGYDITDMATALKRINFEVDNNLQWQITADYPISFFDFKHSERTVAYLAGAFVMNYERPAGAQQQIPYRQQLAMNWRTYIAGLPPKSNMNLVTTTATWWKQKGRVF